MTLNDIDTHANYIKNGSTPITAPSSNNNNNNNNNKLNSGGRKFSWVKRLMKNNNTPNSDRYIKPSPSQQHQKRTAVLVPRVLPHPPTTTQLIQFDPSIDSAVTRTGSLQSSSTDLLSRIPILSLSSQSMVSSSLDEDDSQQSTTATSVLPTTGPGGGAHNSNNNITHLNQSSNYIHLNTMHNHALLDDSSIVTLASSNRRCRSFDSNTNLSTLGIPPLSIIERQQISLNNGITSPNSPILNGQQSRYSTGTTGGGADSGSIKTHWTLEKHIGEES